MLLVAALGGLLALGLSAWSLLRPEPAPPTEAEAVAAASAAQPAPARPPLDAGPRLVEPPPLRTATPPVAPAAGPSDDSEDVDTDEDRAPSETGALVRADMVSALGRVEDTVLDCYGPEGRGTLKFVIAASGHVVSAKVAGPLAGTKSADCVEAAAMAAVFRSNPRESTNLLWALPLHAGHASVSPSAAAPSEPTPP